MKKNTKELVYAGIMGACVGDALGVPVEFKYRSHLKRNPLVDMIGYGTHSQPEGTWSDDSSLMLCLVESLIKGYNLQDVANKFIQWFQKGYMTPHGTVFDIGRTTSRAIRKLIDGVSPLQSGYSELNENGNGSLMRILPLCYYINSHKLDEAQKYQTIKEVSAITHGHIISIISCYIYIDFCLYLLQGRSPVESYQCIRKDSSKYKSYLDEPSKKEFILLLDNDISSLKEDNIHSSGYVIHTLEASIWSLLTSNSYSETVLKGINLGDDTDTTGCVAGGLAGLYYGYSDIPEKWLNKIVKKDEILSMCDRFFESNRNYLA